MLKLVLERAAEKFSAGLRLIYRYFIRSLFPETLGPLTYVAVT
jgi:hypothetical protein